ncbi:MAG: hypothetical protein WC389_18785 [Lutibacter sp.]|jgi:hypothetical protein
MESKTKKCKQCQTDIPFNAKKCPNCQSDLRSWFSRHPIITILVLLIFIPIVIAHLSPSSSNESAPSTNTPQAEEKTLKADIKYDIQNLTITKKDDFNWHSCRIQITAGTSGLLGDGITYEPTTRYNLQQKTGVIPLVEFIDKNGTRFNVFATKPNGIFIFCTEGSYEGNF